MTVAELTERMTAAEEAHWVALYKQQPFGGRADDIRTALLAQMQHNTHAKKPRELQDFILFQPKPEVKMDFYAEIPVAINVTGDYHGVATFFESVAELNRIVNIRDINIAPEKDSTSLTTTCTAVTYKFIEASETPEDASNQTKRKKKR